MRTGKGSVFRLGIPNPGSLGAVADGCRCPMFDNHLGEGFEQNGKVQWVVSTDCTMHNGETDGK